MVVTVKLFAGFRQGRFKEAELNCEDGITAAEVITSLGIDLDEVGIVMVNSRQSDAGRCLASNDILAVFPVIGGG